MRRAGSHGGVDADAMKTRRTTIDVSTKMTNHEVDGVSVVAPHGRIVFGEESNALREKLKGLMAEGKKKIVLNMANIESIDSSGLGPLVAAHLSARMHPEEYLSGL
jgi:anti-anti-sigma factor